MDGDIGMTWLDVDEDEQAGSDGDSALGEDRYTYGFRMVGARYRLMLMQDHHVARIVCQRLQTRKWGTYIQ